MTTKSPLMDASRAAEKSLSLLERVQYYTNHGSEDDIRKLLTEIDRLGKDNASIILEAEEDFMKVGKMVSMYPQKPKHFKSAHAAMAMIWQLCSMVSRRTNIPLPKDICGWLGIDPELLREMVLRERAKLADLMADRVWVEQKYVADQLETSSPQVGNWCDQGLLETNGLEGKKKLISEDSVIRFASAKGMSYTIKGK